MNWQGVEEEKQRCETSAGEGRKHSCTQSLWQNMQTSTNTRTETATKPTDNGTNNKK